MPARVLKLLLAVFMLVTLAAVVADSLELGLLRDPARLLDDKADLATALMGVLSFLHYGAYLLTAIGFLVWFHRAYTNLPALGMEPLPYGRGWVIGGWLVPGLSLFRPKQIMDNIWRGSDPDRPSRLDGFWHKGPVPALLHVWWALFLVSALVDRLIGVIVPRGASTADVLRATSISFLFIHGLGLVAGVLCFEVVRRTTLRQSARAAAAHPADLAQI